MNRDFNTSTTSPLFKKRSVVLNHTVSDGATHGVMHHFWTTGAEHVIDMIQMVSIWIPIVCTAITTHKYLIYLMSH